MTLHWWMHWFWITALAPTIVSLFFVAPLSLAAPQFSLIPLESSEVTLPSLVFSSDTPEHPKFHHDSSLYVALLHDAASPPTFAEDIAEDSFNDGPPPASVFPHHLPDPVTLHDLDEHITLPVEPTMTFSPSPADHDGEEASNGTLDAHDNPMDDELLSSDVENEEKQTQMFERDISLSSRSGKAIGRDFISSTSSPEIVTTASLISNHNPFIAEEPDSSSSDEREVLPDEVETPIITPANADEEDLSREPSEAAVEQRDNTTTAPPVLAATGPSTAKPDLPAESEADVTPPDSPVELETKVSTAPPPAWVPNFSSEEESAEETEAEENARPDSSVADSEAQGTEGSEAVTKGRMTAEQGLDAPSIVGIVLGLLALVSLVGGSVGFVLYRRQFLNKPQTLNDKCSNADSSGYIDDTLRVSATRMNLGASTAHGIIGGAKGRAGKPSGATPHPNKDNSEEMYSLDNDSFLNSLEAMTIQNYWTDSVKHTKL